LNGLLIDYLKKLDQNKGKTQNSMDFNLTGYHNRQVNFLLEISNYLREFLNPIVNSYFAVVIFSPNTNQID